MIPLVIEKLAVIVFVYMAKTHREFGVIALAEHSKMQSSYMLYIVHFMFHGIWYKFANVIFLSPESSVSYVTPYGEHFFLTSVDGLDATLELLLRVVQHLKFYLRQAQNLIFLTPQIGHFNKINNGISRKHLLSVSYLYMVSIS